MSGVSQWGFENRVNLPYLEIPTLRLGLPQHITRFYWVLIDRTELLRHIQQALDIICPVFDTCDESNARRGLALRRTLSRRERWQPRGHTAGRLIPHSA
ncbi:hypothetical protein GSS88_06605 [Corynebacterium sp. 3HC-13]|uniref:hypothetical protein n=1 Tax=Corynebacterium poyangense TaxID=2684405 RepID=UPI001CCB7D9C|nr:hypothetical protein [Corynebacterium poyangense]MBZ8177466.1 hypothetical protein [Corynebacterium poyangense]